MKKGITLISAILIFYAQSFSQTPTWEWAITVNGSGAFYSSDLKSVATDANGNVFVTGLFWGTANFVTDTFTNSGYADVFVAKYDPAGNVLWARNAVGIDRDLVYSIATDANGNAIITGNFISPTITFGTITLANANPGVEDMFIVKYDPAGNVIWAKSMGGVGFEDGRGVTTDGNNNILVTGCFLSSSITFGTISLINTDSLQSHGNIFVVKYDPNGNTIWAINEGGTGNYGEIGYDVACDNTGNVFITGTFSSPTLTFGNTTLNNLLGIGAIYIAKYDANGNPLWAKSANGNFSDNPCGIATDNTGNVFITGYLGSTNLTFDTITLTQAGGATNGYDMFIAKYDANGNAQWANSAGGVHSDFGFGVATDNNGNVLVTGSFASPFITFGATTLVGNSLARSSFITKYDPSGNVLWAVNTNGTGDDQSNAIAIDANDNAYICGYYKNSACTFGSTTLPPFGALGNMFVAKLDNTTGINSLFQQEADINIYPNPVSNFFTLNYAKSKQEQFLEIKDISGRLIIKTNLQSSTNHKNIDASFLAKGIYIATVFNSNNFSSSQKLVVN